MTEDLDKSKTSKDKMTKENGSSDDKNGSDPDPVFLIIHVLERGENFGAGSLIFDDQPVLSVVSNGAQCIMLSKKFYLQHASESNIETLKRTECPYPTFQKMQEDFQGYMSWIAYKADIYNEKIELIERRNQNRKQNLPQYIGQYSHRTGPC